MKIGKFNFLRTNEKQGEIYYINVLENQTTMVITYDLMSTMKYVINSDLNGTLIQKITETLDSIEAEYEPEKELETLIRLGCVFNEDEYGGMICAMKGFIFDLNAEHFKIIMKDNYSSFNINGFIDLVVKKHKEELKASGNMVIIINNQYCIG